MSHLVPATAEYTRTRQQYGAPLAKFQVLQHRMADMYIQTETARSMAYVASLSLGAPAAERVRIVSAAQAQVGRRSEEHTSELQSLMRISSAVFCLKKKNAR